MKHKETLEEFIDKVDTPADFDQFTFDEGIRIGVKWHQEQNKKLYSEEDMREAFYMGGKHIATEGKIYEQSPNFETWFEQFKKTQ